MRVIMYMAKFNINQVKRKKKHSKIQHKFLKKEKTDVNISQCQ